MPHPQRMDSRHRRIFDPIGVGNDSYTNVPSRERELDVPYKTLWEAFMKVSSRLGGYLRKASLTPVKELRSSEERLASKVAMDTE